MKITFVHPSIGRRKGEDYMRTWQMELLPVAALKALTPPEIETAFYDDRMEAIAFDAPTDLVAIPIETYTAKRAYQIATEYRRRGVPVVMGGFHATLMPDEVADYADAVVIGEAEAVWPEVVDDARHGVLKPLYKGRDRRDLNGVRFDRSVFRGKRYLPLGLVETGRGCRFPCEFCAIQTFFGQTHRRRPVDEILAELQEIKAEKKLFFFIDDNFAGSIPLARELAEALPPVNIRWVTQMSIDAAHDEGFVETLARAGCRGVLIGFESLERDTLRLMQKKFNTMGGGYGPALANLRRHGIRVYGTFIFGYGTETPETFENAYDFAADNNFFLAAFNHLTPFPGTALYDRLARENRLHYKAWWLEDSYAYNTLPFETGGIGGEAITRACVDLRKRFYSIPNMIKRGFSSVNRSDFTMLRAFFLINALHRAEVNKRHLLPFGDPDFSGPPPEARLMSGFTFDLAEAEDDPSISDLLAQSELPGWINLSYRSSSGAHGMLHPQAVSQTLVARGAKLAGMVTRSTYPGFFGGRAQDLSYLGHFRVAPFARRRVKLLRQAFDTFHDRFGAGWSFASLVDDNNPAKRLLTSGLPGFPRFAPVGQFKTIVLRSLKPATMALIRGALPHDMPHVAAFHRALARSLAPVLSAEDLAQGRWPGLAPQDILIAERAGELVGFVALWDQRRFRQMRVTGYRRPLSAFRGVANLLGPLTGFPHLPNVGKDLALGYLSFLSVQPGDHDTALRLVEAARRLAGARGLQGVALGLAADDPLLHRLRLRAATYGSCIYTVSWQDGTAPPPSDFIGMQPDIGLL